MARNDVKKNVMDFLVLAAGSILVAFATASILKPSGLITGGLTGISIIMEKFIYINYAYIYYTLSVGTLIAAWSLLGKKEGIKIIVLSLGYPLVLITIQRLNFSLIKDDLMLAAVYYGIVCGIGIGLILKRGYTMGGTDTIAKILHKKVFTFVGISEILLFIDGVIIASSALIYNLNIALYAIISQILFVVMINTVLFGFGSQKVKLEIISSKHEDITQYILQTLKRGVTSYKVKGEYMDIERLKILTICSSRESMLIKKHIAALDSDAFVYVEPVISVWGKGPGFDSIDDNI